MKIYKVNVPVIETVKYVRLLPSCGCEGDRNGFMIETIGDVCTCPDCVAGYKSPANVMVTKYVGLNAELTESEVQQLNDDPNDTARYELIPGVFSMTWHGQKHDPWKAKWASIEEYRDSDEAKKHTGCK